MRIRPQVYRQISKTSESHGDPIHHCLIQTAIGIIGQGLTRNLRILVQTIRRVRPCNGKIFVSVSISDIAQNTLGNLFVRYYYSDNQAQNSRHR